MSEAQKVFEKIERLSLPDLLTLCATAIESKMEEKRLSAILMLLETKLQSRRMMIRLNIKSDL